MGRPLSGPGFLEGRLTEYLERFFAEIGVPCERQSVSPGRDNVIARYESPRAARTILFDAHQDTVPTDGMTIPPFVPEVAGARLYGRGSCDVKGGMAAMLLAFKRLVQERPKRSASVVMACTVDEEFTHTGSSTLAGYPHRADLAIVAEPTRLNIVDRHKGAVRWKVRARGVACHSSTPELGANAIYRMATVVSALAEHAAQLSDGQRDPVLGPATLSVGRIEGGQSVNVVPDWSEIEVDRRVIPGESPAEAYDRVARFLRERFLEPDWLEFQPPWVNMPALSGEGSGARDWLAGTVAAVGRATGQTPEVMGVPYGTDAGPLSAGGLPSLVFGPGDIAQAHTRDEWIELDQVRMAADAYYQIACEFGG
jgi:acetylornithine deacetylase